MNEQRSLIHSLWRKVPDKKLDDKCLCEPETKRFLFELDYPSCLVQYNCTTSQGEYLCINDNKITTVCPISLDPIYIVSYYI